MIDGGHENLEILSKINLNLQWLCETCQFQFEWSNFGMFP